MEVILKQNVPGLGNKHTMVTVKPGYGRNYLIPRKIAIVANAANKKVAQQYLDQIEKKEEKFRSDAKILAEKLATTTIKLKVKAGDQGKIFGTVTALQIAEYIHNTHGINIEPKTIIINQPIKEVGTYEATFNPYKSISQNIKIEVTAT